MMRVGEVGTIWINSHFAGGNGGAQHFLKPTTDESAIYPEDMIASLSAMRSFSAVVSHILVGGLIISLLCGS